MSLFIGQRAMAKRAYNAPDNKSPRQE